MENHVERATHSDHRATYAGDDSDSGEEAVVGGERNVSRRLRWHYAFRSAPIWPMWSAG